MALVGKNIVTKGLTGMLGETIVFRLRGGQTVVATAPEKQDRIPTTKEKAHREKFGRAILYGKAVVKNPEQKTLYETQADENTSAYNVAVADFMNAPMIDEVDVSLYTGEIGSTIRVRATDDFMVSAVNVKIENPDGTLAEEGLAVVDETGLDYIFTAKKKNTSLEGDKITIEVNDLPGNETVVSQVL